jgi:hypothetical protein
MAHQSRLRPAMTRGTAIAALCVCLMACQVGAQATPSPTPTPVPSPTPHTAVADAALTASDVPSGLTPCGGTQTIDAYIAGLGAADPSVAGKTADEWAQLKAEGAREAAISLFAADTTACTAELAATSKTKAAASFVAVFNDDGQADRAWESGVLGFAPPAPGENPPGMARGASTGLGVSSWTYSRAPVQLACWHRSVFVTLVVATNLDATAFKAMTAAVDARLN